MVHAWEHLLEVFVMLVLLLLFIRFSLFKFSFWHHPSPFLGLLPVLEPFCTFSPAYCRVICDTFNFNHSVIFLPRALRFWVGICYPQAFFTLCSFPTFWHNLLLSRLPWEPAVISQNLQGFILILKTQTRPICLFDSQ